MHGEGCAQEGKETQMNDWSTHILSARKAVANLEAALTLRRFDLARHELILAKVAMNNLSGWLDEQEDRTMQLGLDNLGGQG